MGRIRSIKPEYPKDELLGTLPRDVRLLYVLLWTLADDQGRFRASPALVRAELFPYDEDLTQHQVGDWLHMLEEAGRIRLYAAEQQQYGIIVKWKEHQRIDKPSDSKFPAPPREDSPKPPRGVGEESARVPGGIGREGKGIGGEEKHAAASPPLVLTPQSRKPKPGHPDHKRTVDGWTALYRSTHNGSEPTWGAAQGAMVKGLLSKHPHDEIMRRAGLFFASDCPRLKSFVANFDRISAPVPTGKPPVINAAFRDLARTAGVDLDPPPEPSPPVSGAYLMPPPDKHEYRRTRFR
jgi:hypothetical protein